MFLTLCIYYISCLLVKSQLNNFGSLHTIAGQQALVWHWSCKGCAGLCATGGMLQSWGLCRGACVHSPASRSSCKRNRKGKLQEQRGLVPLQPYSGRSGPFPGRVAVLSSLCWTADPWGGQCLSDTEHEPHVVGSAKYVRVYRVLNIA